LVDEVIKVFKKHTDGSVLLAAATTLRVMLGYEMLRTSHEAKIEALGASLVESFLVHTSAVSILVWAYVKSTKKYGNILLTVTVNSISLLLGGRDVEQ